MASNQVEAYNRAKKAYDEAKAANVTGTTLATLKAAVDAAHATMKSATGSSSTWGVAS